jgi:hypothetical protein
MDKEAWFKLLKQKGIFPREHINSFAKLEDTKKSKKFQFYSSLRGQGISYKHYQRFKKVWRIIRNVTICKYSDLYLWTDVLLVADVFENFRDVCLKGCGLDPAYYYTLLV